MGCRDGRRAHVVEGEAERLRVPEEPHGSAWQRRRNTTHRVGRDAPRAGRRRVQQGLATRRQDAPVCQKVAFIGELPAGSAPAAVQVPVTGL